MADAAKRLWRSFVAALGGNRIDAKTLSALSPDEAMRRLAEGVARGQTLGRAPKGRGLSMDAETTPEPTAAERAEAQRQYNEVVARYTNADGTKKPGWMKAPNGKPTKLTERQWVQVRTENFKRWFGDWEMVGVQHFLETESVAKATGEEYLGANWNDIKSEVGKVFSSVGNVVSNPELGVVKLTNNGINDTIRKGIGRNKLAAFNFIPQLIERGRVIKRESNWKERNYDTAVLCAPIDIGTKHCAAFVVVRRYHNGDNNFYLHEVELVDALKEKVNGLRSGLADNGEGGPSIDFMMSVAQTIYGVNENSVSKVVDENGEPMVVYHGTPHYGFTVFDIGKFGERDGGHYGKGFYFTPSKDYAASYAKPGYWNFNGDESKVYGAFLNIRNPKKVDRFKNVRNENELGNSSDGTIAYGDKYYELPWDDARNTNEIVAISPSQIKSATDNAGTFSGRPDIRFDTAPAATVTAAIMDGAAGKFDTFREYVQDHLINLKRIEDRLGIDLKDRVTHAEDTRYGKKEPSFATLISYDFEDLSRKNILRF